MSLSPISKGEILLAVDFCDALRPLIACAKQLAALWKTSVRLVHVIDLTGEPSSAGRSFAASRDSAERQLRDLRHELRLSGTDATATLIAAGRPAQALREAAAQMQPRLLLLGLNGTRSRRLSTVGVTTRSLLLQPPCPLMTIALHSFRPAPDPTLTRPLFVTDGAPESLDAALRLWPLPHSAAPQSDLRAVLTPEAASRPEFSREIRERFASARAIPWDGAAHAVLRDAGENSAEAAGPIVLSLRAGGPADRFTRGTLGHGLITGALCPVVTVRC